MFDIAKVCEESELTAICVSYRTGTKDYVVLGTWVGGVASYYNDDLSSALAMVLTDKKRSELEG